MAGKKKNRVLKLIYDAIKEKRGDEILCLDTRKLTYLFDYLFICSADTDIQARAIMDNIYIKMKKSLKRIPNSIDGSEEGNWIIMDYGDVMVHIFNPIKRIYYNLESIWVDAKAIDLEES
jgi:ribosome-associated protein